jgi:hypothetical protein
VEASAAAADAAAAASGASTFELPVFGNVTTTEFDAGVSVETVASLGATCGSSYWRIMVLPLAVYLLWQVFYFLATELPCCCCCCSCCCGAGRAAPGAGGASADASASADSDGAADATGFGGASSRRRRHLLADPSQETSLRWMIRREQEGALVRSALWLAAAGGDPRIVKLLLAHARDLLLVSAAEAVIAAISADWLAAAPPAPAPASPGGTLP